MAQNLITAHTVTALAPGDSVTFTHGIVDHTGPLTPHVVYPDRVTSIIPSVITDTEITFTNAGGAVETARFLILFFHSIETPANNPSPPFAWNGDALSDDVTELIVFTPSASAAVVDPDTRIVLCDTTQSSGILYVPAVASGRLTVKIIAGTLPVQVTPDTPSEAINGTAGATYVIDPTAGQTATEFLGDIVDLVWWRSFFAA